MKIRPIILCGGAGTRLWPQSKKNLPKQFIDWGGWTLLGKTLERIKSPIYDYPIITTNLSYLELVKIFLKKYKFKKYRIILEPFKKNTAPAMLSSALLNEIPEKQALVFFPADNLIKETSKFNKALISHKEHLNNNNIFVFGIKPTSPSSEYGYFLTKKISKKINKVTQFIEKPNKNKVNLIIKKKGHMNAGMFFIRKDSLINNFSLYQNKMLITCSKAVEKSTVSKFTYYLNRLVFKKVKEISFDYAILEKAKDINAIKLNLSLTDLGNWKEIFKFFKKQTSSYLKKNTYYRPWGKYINLFKGDGFMLKELIIKPKSSISLQKHFHRSERWTVISGKPKITINKKKFFVKENENVLIPKGAVHRIENFYKESVRIAEVQMGSILKETDIVRFNDIYGRK